LLLDLAAAGLSREEAYKLVQTHAMRAWKEGLTFRDEIAKDTAITSRLSAQQLQHAFDYRRQLENVDAIFRRVLGAEEPAA
jgi:adenylosuccinate lyase